MSTQVASRHVGSQRRALSLVRSSKKFGFVLIYAAVVFLIGTLVVTGWQAALEVEGRSVVPTFDSFVSGLPIPERALRLELIGFAVFSMWAGYCLRILALVGQTQLMNFE